jgi:hypothetical protein
MYMHSFICIPSFASSTVDDLLTHFWLSPTSKANRISTPPAEGRRQFLPLLRARADRRRCRCSRREGCELHGRPGSPSSNAAASTEPLVERERERERGVTGDEAEAPWSRRPAAPPQLARCSTPVPARRPCTWRTRRPPVACRHSWLAALRPRPPAVEMDLRRSIHPLLDDGAWLPESLIAGDVVRSWARHLFALEEREGAFLHHHRWRLRQNDCLLCLLLCRRAFPLTKDTVATLFFFCFCLGLLDSALGFGGSGRLRQRANQQAKIFL